MPEPVGFFTDTTVCIGCKACQVACHQWNDLPAWTDEAPQGHRQSAGPQRRQLRQHAQPVGRQLAARQVHRAVHRRRQSQPGGLADDVRRVQTLQGRPVSGSLSDRRHPAHRVRYRLHQSAGLQRLPRLPLGLSVRRHPHERQGRSPRNAPSVTTGSSRDSRRPAPRRVRHSRSNFGPLAQLKKKAAGASRSAATAGRRRRPPSTAATTRSSAA